VDTDVRLPRFKPGQDGTAAFKGDVLDDQSAGNRDWGHLHFFGEVLEMSSAALTCPGLRLHFCCMIAFKNFLRRKPVRRLKLPNPKVFVLIRGAEEERIDAVYDESGETMLKLIVYTRTK